MADKAHGPASHRALMRRPRAELARMVGDLVRMLPDDVAGDARAHLRGTSDDGVGEPITIPANGWACFQCGETFRTLRGAQVHFGMDPSQPTACRTATNDVRRVREVIALTKERYGPQAAGQGERSAFAHGRVSMCEDLDAVLAGTISVPRDGEA